MTDVRGSAWRIPLGLFLVVAATLMYEILLTRIFSVILWYHFASLAVSLAMLGLTVGALIVFLRPGRYTPERAPGDMGAMSALFGLSLAVSLLLLMRMGFLSDAGPLGDALSFGLLYVLSTVPLVFSGIAVALGLTRSVGSRTRLYAADLSGAAAGCLLAVAIMEAFGSVPVALLVTGLLPLAAAFVTTGAATSRGGVLRLSGAALLVGGCVAVLLTGLDAGVPWLQVWRSKGQLRSEPLYERWNSYSHVQVYGDPDARTPVRGWGLGRHAPRADLAQLTLEIDVAAGTWLTRYDGDVRSLDFLRYDVTNVVHHVRSDADVAIIGVGGGRDLLSALAFRQKSVLGIEVNPLILEALTGRFGGFTGHLDRDPRVRLVRDEARCHLAGSERRFDIIQASLIDTVAAANAGAFALVENSLYTVEGWSLFVERLTPRGILSFTRWVGDPEFPVEMLRLVSLAAETLRRRGVEDPSRHLAVVFAEPRAVSGTAVGVGTMLLSREPFGEADLARLEEACGAMGFDLVLASGRPSHPLLGRLADPVRGPEYLASLPLDLSAPTDDRPFFFNSLRPGGLLRLGAAADGAIGVLRWSALGTGLAALGCLAVPVALRARGRGLPRRRADLAVVAAIGLGYLFVEIALLQKLSLFLGNPVYSLSVVLFTLLLAGGLGSLAAGWVARTGRRSHALVALVGVLIVLGTVLIPALEWGATAPAGGRVLLSVLLLAGPGFLMGIPFPVTLSRISGDAEAWAPWYWAVNGAMSVCASVAGAMVCLFGGTSSALWTGAACYAVAAAASLLARD